MPEFIADTDGTVAGKQWDDLSPFVQGYIEAMLFTSTEPGTSMVEVTPDHEWNDGFIPEDSGFGDIYPGSLERAIADCEGFQKEAADLLSQAYERGYTEEQAGRDFWFTRCGHGVGYWDREQLEEGDLGDKLSELCGWRTNYPEVDATFGNAADGSESPTGYGFVFIE